MTDKKIISMILILMIIMSSFAPIVMAASTDEVKIADSAIIEELKAWHIDKNNDGKISQEEIKNVVSLEIPEEATSLSGLEYAENIKNIYYNYGEKLIDFSPINAEKITGFIVRTDKVIDLSFLKQFTNIKSLSIISTKTIELDLSAISDLKNVENLGLQNIVLSDLEDIKTYTNLESLSISGGLDTADKSVDLKQMSNLKNLKDLFISNIQVKNINSISSLNSLEYVTFSRVTGIADLSALKDKKTIISLYISSSDLADVSFIPSLTNLKTFTLSDIKASDKEIASLYSLVDYKAYVGERFYVKTDIYSLEYNDWDYESDNESVATVEKGEITAHSQGTANIKLTLKKDTTITKTMKVTVTGISSNQPIGAYVGSSIQIRDNIILNANGDLWKTYDQAGTVEKLDSNVKKYVYEFIYTEDNQAFHYTLTQKNDNSVKYVFNGVEIALDNVKEIYNTGYLANDGTYYTIKENGKWEKVTDGVKDIVGDYLVKTDGKTYTVENDLVCSFEIVDARDSIIVDKNGVVWKVPYNGTELEKIGDKFKEFVTKPAGVYDTLYHTTDGKIMDISLEEKEYLYQKTLPFIHTIQINKDNKLLLNGKEILTNVELAIHKVNYEDETYKYYVQIVRSDGSIWNLKLSGKASLVKLTQQEDSVYFKNEAYVLKPTANVTTYTAEIITGFDVKKLDVANALASTNFKSGYTAKAYKEDEELTSSDKISTGSIIKLYSASGELLEEYTAIVYGDVTGSGNPSAKDALAIIKNKTGKVKIEDGLYLEAARVTKSTRQTAGEPNASDALAIVKSKLGKYTIEV